MALEIPRIIESELVSQKVKLLIVAALLVAHNHTVKEAVEFIGIRHLLVSRADDCICIVCVQVAAVDLLVCVIRGYAC